jgi:hypothetical protein
MVQTIFNAAGFREAVLQEKVPVHREGSMLWALQQVFKQLSSSSGSGRAAVTKPLTEVMEIDPR